MDISSNSLKGMTKVLIVEDEMQIAQLYEHVLSKAGMMAKIALDGKTALEVLTKENFDIVFIDVMMPGMNGIDLLKNIRMQKINPEMAVYFLTNIEQEAVLQQGFSLGIQGYLVKAQLAPQQLLEIVKNNTKNSGSLNAAVKIPPPPQSQPGGSGWLDKIFTKFTKN